jgi:hypothetical protein
MLRQFCFSAELAFLPASVWAEAVPASVVGIMARTMMAILRTVLNRHSPDSPSVGRIFHFINAAWSQILSQPPSSAVAMVLPRAYAAGLRNDRDMNEAPLNHGVNKKIRNLHG